MISDGYVEKPLNERVISHCQSLTIPSTDMQGLMRHIIDCLGTLKVRLEQEVFVENHSLQIFSQTVKLLVDHITHFEPIDTESGIKYLLEAFPDEAKRRDGRLWLPLHWAAANTNTTPEILEAVIDERPMQLMKGHLHYDPPPLQDEMELMSQTQVAKPLPTLQRPYKGMLPIHFACSLKYNHLQNIQLLVKKQPESIKQVDDRGWLPIHYCAYNNRSGEIMSYLIQTYPQGCYEVNKKGQLPFHLACYNRYLLMMELLYQENPEVLDSLDYNGNTPLHAACKSLNYEAVKKLLGLKAELNVARNFKEELAIHKVFSYIPKEATRLYFRQLECVKAIAAVNPEVLTYADREDRIALHLAIYYHASYELIEYIYNIYPSAALVKDSYGKLPIHYVQNANVKKLLMKSSPPLLKVGITDSFSRFVS